MSLATSPLVTSSHCPRRSVNYHPSIWGDHFIQYASESVLTPNMTYNAIKSITKKLKPQEVADKMEEQIKKLKEKVRKMLILPTKKPTAKMHLIDLIQRLGVDYHFELEIDDQLQQIHNSYVENGIITLEEDLDTLALLLRLLRQHGYRISPEIFKKFKDEEGNISEGLTNDVEGMLSLYEAAHLGVHGENILDEALAFTSAHLESVTAHLSPSLATKVSHRLRRPLRKNLPRLEAWHYISSYQEDPSHDETLLALAKLDFNMLQKLHQKEVGNISKWWKDLDFVKKLPFARNRMVEAYFWILGAYFEPCYSLARKITTKVTCLISVIDDIYDVYGTLEELQLFTEAIERWDISYMDLLPEYMKVCYQALLDVYEEIEQDMSKEGRTFYVNYAKNEMKKLIKAYFEEAKWFYSNYTPTLEEYMGVAQISCAYPAIIATSFMGMGCIATEEGFQWLANNPKIVRASTIICRLMDDIVSNKLEQERGHVASAIECYMEQHEVTKQDAIEELCRQVRSAWKDINEECLESTQVPKQLLMTVLNLSRVMDVLYKDLDCYTHPVGEIKDYISALLLKPFPM